MRFAHFLAIVAVLSLAACGGGGGGAASPFDRMVVFGDSLSDVGSYRVGSVAAAGGGRWTINTAGSDNWTELLALSVNLPVPCAAETGLAPNVAGVTGAAVAPHAGCFDYAEGGARVTSTLALRSAALQAPPFNQVNIGLLAKPASDQVAAHLAASGGQFGANNLVTVLAGGNDALANLAGFSAAAGGGAAASGAAAVAGWDAGVQAAVAAGGPAASTAASNAAMAAMSAAGAQLATLVKTQMLAKGATHVVVVNLRNLARTPFGQSLPLAEQVLLTNLTTSFNTQLQAGLAGSTALLVDLAALQEAELTQAASFGLTNVTTPACNPALPANALAGLALACTPATLAVADATGYLFSDSVHFTPYGYAILATIVLSGLQNIGWVPVPPAFDFSDGGGSTGA